MKTLWMALLALGLTGCASTGGGPRVAPFGARFDPTIDMRGAALCVINRTGHDLHAVKLSIFIIGMSGRSMSPPYGEVAEWENGREIVLTESLSHRALIFPQWCREVRLSGTCAEGKIKETFRLNF